MTSQLEIANAEIIVKELNDILKNEFNFIDSVQLNDWGRFGNFNIFIYIKSEYKYRAGLFGKGIAQRIKGICNRKFKQFDGILRGIYFPEAVYRNFYRRNTFDFYRCNYISIDLDFRLYNKNTNKFK